MTLKHIPKRKKKWENKEIKDKLNLLPVKKGNDEKNTLYINMLRIGYSDLFNS